MYLLKFASLLVAVAVLCSNSASALVIQNNVTITDIVKDIAVSLRSRRQSSTNYLTCAKVIVRYSEPVVKVYEMTLTSRQLQGLDTIDSSFTLAAGKFTVEVKMTSNEDAYTANTGGDNLCSVFDAADWEVNTDTTGVVTYGDAVNFYGMTSEHDYYIPVAKTIMVICFDTAEALELDARDTYHYAPVIERLNSCPQSSIGEQCTIDISAASLNKWNDLVTTDGTIYDKDWVQRIEVTSVTDVSNVVEIPVKFMFGPSSFKDFPNTPELGAEPLARSDNFFSSSTTDFALLQSRGFQKVIITTTDTLPATGTFVGTGNTCAAADCFEVVAAGTGVGVGLAINENFFLVHTNEVGAISLNNANVKTISYFTPTKVFTSGASCSGCKMAEMYPVTYEVTINAFGKEGRGLTAASTAEDTCAIDIEGEGEGFCKRATQSFSFTMTDANEVSVGAMAAHAPITVIDQNSYDAIAMAYDGIAPAPTTLDDVSAILRMTVTDIDLTQSELAKFKYSSTFAGADVYTEQLTLSVIVTAGAQVPSRSCVELEGGCNYLSCPATQDIVIVDTGGDVPKGDGLTVNIGAASSTDTFTIAISYSPTYACPPGTEADCQINAANTKAALAYYGTQYCTFEAQVQDNTGSLSQLTTAQKEDSGIFQTLTNLKGSEHTFVFGAVTVTQHDFSVIISPAVNFAALTRRSYPPYSAITGETWGAIQLQTTNHLKGSSELNAFPLGKVVAPVSTGSDGACFTGHYDTDFLDSDGNKICCQLLTDIYPPQSCARPTDWCTHAGAVYVEKDCDGDGVKDPTCSHPDGQFGVIMSSAGCSDSWPTGDCTSGIPTPQDSYLLFTSDAPKCISDGTDCRGDGTCDVCSQTLEFALKDDYVTTSPNKFPFATENRYQLCVVYENAQFPFSKTASVIASKITIAPENNNNNNNGENNNGRAARQEAQGSQEPPKQREQSIFLDISPGSIMTVRVAVSGDTEIVVEPGTTQIPGAPTTPSPTPAFTTLDAQETEKKDDFFEAVFGFILGGILLLIVIVVVAVAVLSKQRKEQSKVYPFWAPGPGSEKPPAPGSEKQPNADVPPQFTPSSSA